MSLEISTRAIQLNEQTIGELNTLKVDGKVMSKVFFRSLDDADVKMLFNGATIVGHVRIKDGVENTVYRVVAYQNSVYKLKEEDLILQLNRLLSSRFATIEARLSHLTCASMYKQLRNGDLDLDKLRKKSDIFYTVGTVYRPTVYGKTSIKPPYDKQFKDQYNKICKLASVLEPKLSFMNYYVEDSRNIINNITLYFNGEDVERVMSGVKTDYHITADNVHDTSNGKKIIKLNARDTVKYRVVDGCKSSYEDYGDKVLGVHDIRICGILDHDLECIKQAAEMVRSNKELYSLEAINNYIENLGRLVGEAANLLYKDTMKLSIGKSV